MPGVVEIARFESSEAYRADPSVINPSLEIIAKAKGIQAIFHGLQVEDQKTVYAVIIWDRVEDHKALITDKEAYTTLRAALEVCGSTEHHILHIPFHPDPLPRLRAPLTEVTFLTLKPDQDEKDLDDVMRNVLDKSPTSLNITHGTSWGKTVEKDNLFALTMGWNSLDDERKKIEGNEEAKPLLAKLAELADVAVAHVQLREHKL